MNNIKKGLYSILFVGHYGMVYKGFVAANNAESAWKEAITQKIFGTRLFCNSKMSFSKDFSENILKLEQIS